MTPLPQPPRPREIALVMLAGAALPRKRARDQQPDRFGTDLKQRVLDALAARDPDFAALPAAFEEIVGRLTLTAEPPGPVRAIARGLCEEFERATQDPAYFTWLLCEAARVSIGE